MAALLSAIVFVWTTKASTTVETISANSTNIDRKWAKKCFYGANGHVPLTSAKSAFVNNSSCIIKGILTNFHVHCLLFIKYMLESDGRKCGYRIVDNLFSEADISRLHAIASKGLSTRPRRGGPTILDINTGYVR